MKPETHAVVGIALAGGAVYFSHETLLEAGVLFTAGLAGAVAPDVPIVLQVLNNKRQNRSPFHEELDPDFESSPWFTLKEASHSPLVWIFGLVISWFLWPSFPGLVVLVTSLAVFSHWAIDMVTHCHHFYKRTDQSLLWPLYYLAGRRQQHGQIPKLGYLWGRLTGLCWEYRQSGGDESEKYDDTNRKKPETVVIIVMIGLASVFMLLWLVG